MRSDVATMTLAHGDHATHVTVRESYETIKLWLESDGGATRTFMTSPGDLIKVEREQVRDLVGGGDVTHLIPRR